MSIYRDTEYKLKRKIGEYSLSDPPQTVDFLVPETWYPIPGNYSLFENHNFKLIDDILTYTGVRTAFTFFGVSDAEITENVDCTITYGLFINDAVTPSVSTPHGYQKKAASETISALGTIYVDQGNTFQVKVKCNVNTTDLIVNSLTVSLQEK